MFDVSKFNMHLTLFRPGSAMSYLVAFAVVIAATLLRVELGSSIDGLPYLTLFPGVVIVVVICGTAAGIFAAVSAVIAAWLFIIAPGVSFQSIYQTSTFLIGLMTLIVITGVMRRSTSVIRRLNATLLQSEAKFRGLLESAPDAMVIVDAEGRIALVNAATERLFGYPRETLLGQPAEILMPRAGEELFGVRADGTTFPVEVSHSPLQTEDGLMVSRAIRDITARKRIEAKLVQASRAKSDFLSGMSHELRTPLNAVVGFAELLQLRSGEGLTQKQREYVGYILEGGNHLLVLVTQLLDLAGIEAGRLNLSITAVDVRGVLNYVHGLMAPLANKACVELVLDAPGTIDDVEADELRLRQVLLNFLSNAIKYNRPGGKVVLTAGATPAGIRFTVSDTGIGIPPDRWDELFQPFHRLGAERSHVTGSGIGLAYSRNIVEAMGGSLGFTSEPAVGSVFWADLPATRGSIPTIDPIAEPLVELPMDGAISPV